MTAHNVSEMSTLIKHEVLRDTAHLDPIDKWAQAYMKAIVLSSIIKDVMKDIEYELDRLGVDELPGEGE